MRTASARPLRSASWGTSASVASAVIEGGEHIIEVTDDPTRRFRPPAEGDLLCESCGYILNGLDPSAEAADGRVSRVWRRRWPTASLPDPASSPSPIEDAGGPPAIVLADDRAGAIAAKRNAFTARSLTRTDTPAVARFGRIHRLLAGAGFGLAATFHLAWFAEMFGYLRSWGDVAILALIGLAMTAVSLPMLGWLTRLAVFLTTTESRFWGLRLPSRVVGRAMNFHAANYLPIAAAALTVTAGYRLLLTVGLVTQMSGVPYLVTLCSLVVLSAFWLFESYVVAMRRIRLANF